MPAISVSDAIPKIIIASCIFCFSSCSAEGRWTQLQKGLPTKMSTQWNPAAVPALAYDGNTDGAYISGVQCISSAGGESEPWWMLDMQRTYRIAGVRVWNRLDGNYEARFTQISIGVSNHQSVWTNFYWKLFNLCAYKTGPFTEVENPIYLTCSVPLTGRYLAVHKNAIGTNIFLNFCEIDVFIVQDTRFVAKETMPSFSPTSASLLAAPSKKRSETDCIIECSKLPNCASVLFKGRSLDCWLFGSSSIPNSFISALGDSDAKFVAIGA